MDQNDEQAANSERARVAECLALLGALSGATNERARKETLISHLPRIFPEEQYRARLDSFTTGAEHRVATASASFSDRTRGAIDTLNGTLILEFKANLLDTASLETALGELKRYTAGRWTEKGLEAVFCGVATDTQRWKVFRPVPKEIPADGRFNADMVDLEPIEELDASVANEENAVHLSALLKRLIFDATLLPLTAENLRRDFGLDSSRYGLMLPKLTEIVTEASTETDVELAISLWRQYQTYNARTVGGGVHELYLQHLYLVIVSRLVVAAYYQKGTLVTDNDQTLNDILTGSFFFNELRLANFVERDFFGWIVTNPWLSRLLPFARDFFHQLRSYDFSSVSGSNLLRLIFDEMTPRGQQDELGQHSTPERLAQHVVRHLFRDALVSDKFLDPACGTGSFLHAALLAKRDMLTEEGTPAEEQLERLIDTVVGIDIDPVAVILAKAVWALAVLDLLPLSANPTVIPIFHADSFFIANGANAPANNTGATSYIQFDNVSIEVPSELFANINAFDQIVEWCYRRAEPLAAAAAQKGGHLTPLTEEAVNLDAILQGGLNDELQECSEDLVNFVVALTNEFAKRMAEKRNGIWAFVLRNSYRPSLLVGHFQIIATNPPWLAMSSLPDVSYKQNLESKASNYRIKPRGAAFLHLEVATTFALHAVQHFLTPKGKAAFVMPRRLFNGAHHDAFRTFQFAPVVPFSINEVWDLIGVDNLFRLPSCVIFGVKESRTEDVPDPATPIPLLVWSTLDGNQE